MASLEIFNLTLEKRNTSCAELPQLKSVTKLKSRVSTFWSYLGKTSLSKFDVDDKVAQ